MTFGTVLRGHSRIVASTMYHGDIDMGAISKLRDDVVSSIRGDGGEVEVSITVTGSKEDGFSEHAARAVRENAGQLGIDVEFIGGDGS